MYRYSGEDDQPMMSNIRDISGGINSRVHATQIGQTQIAACYGADISIPGRSKKAPGSTLVGSDVSNSSVVALCNYVRQGYTDTLALYEGTNLREWTGSGNTSAAIKSDFTASQEDVGILACKESGLTPDDIIIVQNGTDNAFRFQKDSSEAWQTQDLGNTNNSPPLTTVMCWNANRVWALKNDLLYFSDAYDSDYSSSFDRTTNAFRIPVGIERSLIATRDMGIIVMGDKAIWSLAPSLTPDPATDQPQPVLSDIGVVSKKAAIATADDIYFFSYDGLRGLKRTVQDKLQSATSFPLSYFLKTEFESIAWAYKDRICMEYFDNKIFIAVPTSSSAFDTWIYYPATQAFTVLQGFSPRCWAKFKVSSEERFYYGKHGNGTIYRMWYGYTIEGTTTSNGTAQTYQEEGRKDDLGYAFVKKQGGELMVKAEASGDYDLKVYASFDDGGYNYLGAVNLSGNLITFPTGFPITFRPSNMCWKKFHLDRYGEWYNIQVKLTNEETATDEIYILDRQVIAYPVMYKHQEEN